jgi:hypothetical protein
LGRKGKRGRRQTGSGGVQKVASIHK